MRPVTVFPDHLVKLVIPASRTILRPAVIYQCVSLVGCIWFTATLVSGFGIGRGRCAYAVIERFRDILIERFCDIDVPRMKKGWKKAFNRFIYKSK